MMTRPGKWNFPFVVALVAGLWAGPAGAACTAIVGKLIQAKNTPKFQVQSKDAAISAAAVDPVTNGASVTISVNAGTVTYTTCSGAEWTGTAATGWKFKRVGCATGIKTAQIKNAKTKFKGDTLGDTGSFPLTVTTDTDVVVASSTTSYAMRFLLADAKKNDGTQYLNKNTTLASGMCGPPPPTTTTTIPSCADCCTHVPPFTRI